MHVGNIANYIKKYNSKNEQKNLDKVKKVKIAILASSTIKGLKEVLFIKCCELGIEPEIHIGGYNQYNQEILNEHSSLYEFKPDLIFFFIDIKSLLGDVFFNYYQLPEKETLLKNHIHHINILISKILRHLNCKIILHNFEVPVNSPLGIIDNKQKLGFIEFVKTINHEINKQFKDNGQVIVFDYDLFCSKWGKENIIDYKMYYLGDIKINFKYFTKLCDEYTKYIIPLVSLTKKCIVLDLDNTLWGGIIGEDGLEGIKLGPTPEGRPFLEFQKYLLSLFNRGVILAINSKNNPDDALNVLRNHPYMILKEKHFASIYINWNDKIYNMKEIAKEINIGLDSIVFFDDDKSNRELIRIALPEITIVDLPADPSLYLKTIMDLNYFNAYTLSEEDKKKGQMYAEQRKRQELSKITTNITEYLKSLEITVTIENASFINISRVSQLTQKTNQFNMTTKRYQEHEIKKIMENKNHLIFLVKVEDKFGDNGITGVAIIEKNGKKWIIDSFLLSCRVIGRQIEQVILAHLVEEAKKEEVEALIGLFVPTNKNAPSKDFYKNNKFKLIEVQNDMEKWEFLTKHEYNYPDFIQVKYTNGNK